MNQREYTILGGAIHRTLTIVSLDKNAVRRQAKRDAIRLLVSDLDGTLGHEYPKTFDRDKFLEACGL